MIVRLSVLLALVSASAPAHAAYLTFSGDAFISTATSAQSVNLGANATQGPLVAGFTERQQVTVAANTVCVDHLIATPGEIFTGGESASTCAAWLPAGTYDSHLLHLDPVTTVQYAVRGASFTFDGEVVALVTGRANLAASDPVLGHFQTWAYSRMTPQRGTEMADSFFVSSDDAFTISVFAIATNTMDEVRVITLPYDADGDGVRDRFDTCEGDDASGDTDVDGMCDTSDNCPVDANGDQSDVDDDGTGDVCEADTDTDGVIDDLDVCPFDFDPDQADNDADGEGDACDDDDDDDGVGDLDDNCAVIANGDQVDTDADGSGDACDGDDDGDGVVDEDDLCFGTPAGVAYDADGCSGAQGVELDCPSGEAWDNHGAYVSCVVQATDAARAAGLLTATEAAAIKRAAAQSEIGH
jgi:hypothetical protein